MQTKVELDTAEAQIELEDKYKDVIQDALWPPHVLSSCFFTLIRLGDLSRWWEQRKPEGGPQRAQAMGFYDLASTMRPDSAIL